MTQEANNSQRFCQPWVSLGLQFGLCGLGGWSNGWGSMGPGAGCGTAGVLGGVTGAADLGLGSLAGGGTGWLVFGPGMVGIVAGCWLAAGWSGLCAGMGPVHGAGGANPGDLTVAFTLESTGNGGLGALGAGVAGAFCMVDHLPVVLCAMVQLLWVLVKLLLVGLLLACWLLQLLLVALLLPKCWSWMPVSVMISWYALKTMSIPNLLGW